MTGPRPPCATQNVSSRPATTAQRRVLRQMLDMNLQIILVRSVYAFSWLADGDEMAGKVEPRTVVALYQRGLVDEVDRFRGTVAVFELSSAGMKFAAKQIRTGLKI